MSKVIEITSVDDPRIDDYRNVRDADLRGGGGIAKWGEINKLFMAESESVIRRMLESDWPIKSMFLSSDRFKSMRDVLEKLTDSLEVFVADDSLLKDISGYQHHHGALSVGVRPPKNNKPLATLLKQVDDSSKEVMVVCEGITNVDNIGAIFRNTAAFGASGVLLDPDCSDPLFRKAIRVSMGHVFNVPWEVSSGLLNDLLLLKQEHGFTLIAAELVTGAIPVGSMPRNEKVAFIFGSEKSGISKEVLSLCDEVYAIPMTEGVPSINVAVSSAVFLYEWSRRR